jgi:hypothetical protein
MTYLRLRWILSCLGLALMASAAAIAPSHPVFAAVCRAETCDTLWPGEAGCRDDQRAMASLDMYIGATADRATVYFSSTCRAAWADFQTDAPDTFLHFQLWAQPQYGGIEREPRNSAGDNYTKVAGTTNLYRSVLASWNYSVKACWSTYSLPDVDPDPIPSEDGNSGECTEWQ